MKLEIISGYLYVDGRKAQRIIMEDGKHISFPSVLNYARQPSEAIWDYIVEYDTELFSSVDDVINVMKRADSDERADDYVTMTELCQDWTIYDLLNMIGL